MCFRRGLTVCLTQEPSEPPRTYEVSFRGGTTRNLGKVDSLLLTQARLVPTGQGNSQTFRRPRLSSLTGEKGTYIVVDESGEKFEAPLSPPDVHHCLGRCLGPTALVFCNADC